MLKITDSHIKLYQKQKIQNSAVWSTFFHSKKHVILVFGDHYFYGSDVSTGGYGVMRDFSINSEKDLDSCLNNKPQLRSSINKLSYTYLTKEGLVFLYKMLPLWKNYDNISIKLASELTYNDIRNNDIFYFGKFKTMGILQLLVKDKYYKISDDFSRLQYLSNDSVKEFSGSIDEKRLAEAAVVLNFKTSFNKQMMIISSMDIMGDLAVLDYMLNPENVRRIEKKIEITKIDNSFIAVFIVTGIGRTDFSIKNVSLEKIND